MNNHPIIIVEDDEDDCNILLKAFHDIGVKNEFRCFKNAMKALEYLKITTDLPFIIISDINMPQMNGMQFKAVINDDKSIHRKRIPFVFLSTAKDSALIEQAFHLSVQGYFQKPDDIVSLKNIARAIIDYWKEGVFQPNAI